MDIITWTNKKTLGDENFERMECRNGQYFGQMLENWGHVVFWEGDMTRLKAKKWFEDNRLEIPADLVD